MRVIRERNNKSRNNLIEYFYLFITILGSITLPFYKVLYPFHLVVQRYYIESKYFPGFTVVPLSFYFTQNHKFFTLRETINPSQNFSYSTL